MSECKPPAIETGNPAEELFHLKRNGKISRRSFSIIEMQRAGEEGGLLLATTTANTPDDLHADHWEVHPQGDELILVLEGEVRLVLEGPDENGTTIRAGNAAIVPQARWHRFKWMGPVTLLFVTPPGGTELREVGKPASHHRS